MAVRVSTERAQRATRAVRGRVGHGLAADVDIPVDNIEEFEGRMRRDVISAITVTEQIRCLISRKLCPLTIIYSPPGHAQPYEIGDGGLSYDTPPS